METQSLGSTLAGKLKGGEIIGLLGNLGAGKTTFIKGLAKGLSIKHRITSPSFALFKVYKIPRKALYFYHFDLWRMRKTREELSGLGFYEIAGSKKNIVAIEWADKLKGIPRGTLMIEFSKGKHAKERIITLWVKK